MERNSLNNDDIARIISERYSLSREDVSRVLEGVLSEISVALEKGEKIELRGFGTFRPSIRVKQSKDALDQSSQMKPKPHFKPYSKFRDKIEESLSQRKVDDLPEQAFVSEGSASETPPDFEGQKGVLEKMEDELERYKKEVKEDAQKRDPWAAVEKYKYILTREPRNVEARNGLGLVYEQLGDYNKAASEFKEVLTVDPNNLDAHYNLGTTYWQSGLFTEAEAEFSKVIEIEPGSFRAHYTMGVLLCKKGHYDRAILDLQRAINIEKNFFEPYYYLGAAHLHKGLYDRAIQSFQKFLESDPNNGRAYWYLGVLYDRKNQPKDALAMYRRAHELMLGRRKS